MDILERFKEYLTTDKIIKQYWQKIKDGKANYYDADKYASIISKRMSQLLKAEYGSYTDFDNVLDDLKADYLKTYSESAYFAKSVQANINASNKIGMKPIEPKMDAERMANLLEKFATNSASWLLNDDVVENIAKSAITDTINANARTQSEAGLYSYIERDAGAGCCAWCNSMAGRYEYGKQPSDFFQVHKDCTCVITYRPSKRPIQRIRYESGRKIVE